MTMQNVSRLSGDDRLEVLVFEELSDLVEVVFRGHSAALVWDDDLAPVGDCLVSGQHLLDLSIDCAKKKRNSVITDHWDFYPKQENL